MGEHSKQKENHAIRALVGNAQTNINRMCKAVSELVCAFFIRVVRNGDVMIGDSIEPWCKMCAKKVSLIAPCFTKQFSRGRHFWPI
jgi:hypothetical protein